MIGIIYLFIPERGETIGAGAWKALAAASSAVNTPNFIQNPLLSE